MNNFGDILLQVKNLSVSFFTDGVKNTVINNLSFEIQRGQTLAIVGESGSGKSVTSLAIMGLLPVPPAVIDSGEIWYNNKNLLVNNSISTIRGNKISMIFQEPMTSLNPLMKCGYQITEALQLHQQLSFKEAQKKAIQLFEEVKIPNPSTAFHKYPHELSGGQKQRVMIAMAICCNPDLIIADEPTTALDVVVQASILELLKELQLKYGMSILFITHDLGVVKNFAHQTMVLYKGQMVELNNTATLFSMPTQAYTRALLSCRPNSAKRVKTLPIVADYLNNKVVPEVLLSEEDFYTDIAKLQTHEEVLSIRNLNLSYVSSKTLLGKPKAYFQALHNINLSIKQGETVGLVGESGCGKTTLGKAIVKLEKYNSGQILFRGQDIYTAPKEFVAAYPQRVQIIFQDPYSSLNPRVTIGKAIQEPLEVYHLLQPHKRKQYVQDLLQQVGLLSEHYYRYPHEFSGGQRQRICIARALAVRPELLVCDESVSALDISVQAQVLNLLNELKSKYNLTLLFITHDLSVVNHFCNKVVVMQKGKIVEENTTVDLFKHPTQEYTRQLLNIANS